MNKGMSQDHIQQLTESDLFKQVSDICAVVNTVTDVQQLLEVSLSRTLRLFGARRGSVFIMDERTKCLVLKAAEGLQQTEVNQMMKRIGEGVVGRVAEQKIPLVVENIETDERFLNYRARTSYQTPSFICAPLLIKDHLIGVINITDKLSGAGFGRADLQLLDFLAMQIALNYRRIELYERFRSILKRSEELKNELGKSSQETTKLRRQIIAHERLATVGKMAGGIAHDFNNPLDGVLRYTNLCLKQVGDDEVIRSYLLEIKNGLNRMTTIVRNLLACSRRSEKPLQMIRPDVVVDQAIQAVQSEAKHKNVRIEKEVGAGLPDLKDLGLESILVNLLRNAVDALKPGGLVKISAAHLEHNGHVVFQVADNGPGIPDSDDPSKIFEPFYTTKDMEKGCGLGLTIVSEIVKSYQGQIQVESAPGEGATFIVTIPIETRDP